MGQSVGASQCRVGYQWGLPHLVFMYSRQYKKSILSGDSLNRWSFVQYGMILARGVLQTPT